MAVAEVKNRIWTLDELRQAHRGYIAMAEGGGRELLHGHDSLRFKGPLTVHIGTTQPKKIDEFEAPLANQLKDIRLSSAVGSLGWWHCDPEESGTYLGNAAGKALSLIDRIYNHHKTGADKFFEGLKASKINPDNFMLVVNDTGYSFQRDYREEEEFRKSEHKAGPISWPGPELGPIIDAHGGVTGFFGDLKEMVQRREAQGKNVLLKGHDEVTYIFFRPTPKMENIRVFSFSARVPVEYILEPLGHQGEVLTSLHFMKLRGEDVPKELREKSIAQIKDEYLKRYSPMAKALGQFFDHVEAPIALRNRFAAKGNIERWHSIATQENLIDNRGYDDPSVSFSLPPKTTISKVRYNHGEQDSLHHMTRNADAVVLQEHSKETLADWNKNFLATMDLWCSLLVKKQVCVETMHAKPLIVLQAQDNKFYHQGYTNGDLNWDDPKTERAFLKYLDGIDPAKDPWLKFMMLTRYLHEKGAIKQEEHHLFTQVDPAAENLPDIIKSKIHESLTQRLEVPNYKRETYGYDQKGMFEVFIGGSAGTHAQDYIDAAEDLAYWSAEQGHHVRTGGGNYGVMGAAARGVLRFMQEHPERADDTYLSLIQTFRTIQFEGAAIDPRKIEDMPNVHMAIEETFDARMANLFRVRDGDVSNPAIGTANVIMMGGIGTVQEATRWMRLKESGVPHMQDQKMIFFNQRQAGDVKERQIRVLDAIIRSYPPEIRKAHIDVRLDLDGVKAAITQRYEEWSRKFEPLIGRTNPHSSRTLQF